MVVHKPQCLPAHLPVAPKRFLPWLGMASCAQHRFCMFKADVASAFLQGSDLKEPKYCIGNIQGRYNGWCYREDMFGVLVDVQVFWDGAYYSRPHPKHLFKAVSELVKDDRWNSAAENLCSPQWTTSMPVAPLTWADRCSRR